MLFYLPEIQDQFVKDADEFYLDFEAKATHNLARYLPPAVHQKAISLQSSYFDLLRKTAHKYKRDILKELPDNPRATFFHGQVSIFAHRKFGYVSEKNQADIKHFRNHVAGEVEKYVRGFGPARSSLVVGLPQPEGLWKNPLPTFAADPKEMKKQFKLSASSVRDLRAWVYTWSKESV